MAGAVARDAPRNDLAAVADEVLQGLRVLVVDDDCLVRAELADALARAATPAGRVGVEIRCPAEVLVVTEVDVALAHGYFSSFSSAAAGAAGAGAGGASLLGAAPGVVQ